MTLRRGPADQAIRRLKMTRFADNIERIRVIEIAGDLVGGPHENVRCTRAFNVDRFSSSRRERRRPIGVSAQCPSRFSRHRVYRWLSRWPPAVRMFRSWEVSIESSLAR